MLTEWRSKTGLFNRNIEISGERETSELVNKEVVHSVEELLPYNMCYWIPSDKGRKN